MYEKSNLLILSLGVPPGLSVTYLTIELFYYLVKNIQSMFDLVLYNARALTLKSTPLRRIALLSEMEENSGLPKWNIFYSALHRSGRRAPLPDGHRHRLGHPFPERNPGLLRAHRLLSGRAEVLSFIRISTRIFQRRRHDFFNAPPASFTYVLGPEISNPSGLHLFPRNGTNLESGHHSSINIDRLSSKIIRCPGGKENCDPS